MTRAVSSETHFWMNFRYSDDSTSSHYWGGTNDNTWHHYAIKRQVNDLVWFKDGLQVYTVTKALVFESYVRSDQGIGARPSDQYGAEKLAMDDFRAYTRALSNSEIAELYSMGNIA
ncbi:LamG-like jellyroll fold domain-containing protein [Candidatus Omnitrophota bacterium]